MDIRLIANPPLEIKLQRFRTLTVQEQLRMQKKLERDIFYRRAWAEITQHLTPDELSAISAEQDRVDTEKKQSRMNRIQRRYEAWEKRHLPEPTREYRPLPEEWCWEDRSTEEYGSSKDAERGHYIRVHFPEHPDSEPYGGWIPVHRLIMEKHLRRLLEPDEVVHHINYIRNDNRIENLEVMSVSNHRLLHNLGLPLHPDLYSPVYIKRRIRDRERFGKFARWTSIPPLERPYIILNDPDLLDILEEVHRMVEGLVE